MGKVGHENCQSTQQPAGMVLLHSAPLSQIGLLTWAHMSSCTGMTHVLCACIHALAARPNVLCIRCLFTL